ncbi:hypothetical protein UlMin_017249 [Ulmus minor]
METGIVGNGVFSSESVDGSRDVWSCKNLILLRLIILLSCVADWKFAAEQFVKLLPNKVSERNVSMLTLDGVDVMGQRLVEEPNLKKISFVAHSVGGLVARYAIGKLYRASKIENVEDSSISGSEEDSRGTIGGLEAMNFVTVATPHLGSRGNKQLRIHLIFRRTGRHLFLTNFDEGKPPLLKRMIEDYEDCYFMSALHTFKRRMLYSNVGYDHIVGWRTSSIRRNFEQPKWKDTVNENYPHVVYEEHCKACDAEESEATLADDDSSDKLEEELVIGLSCVSCEKVDVSFQNSRQRFVAYSIIQVYNIIIMIKNQPTHCQFSISLHSKFYFFDNFFKS